MSEAARANGKKRAGVGGAVLLAAALGVGIVAASPAAMAQDDILAAARTMTPPEYAGPTTPAKAPKGIKIAVITCASVLHGCVSPADGMAARSRERTAIAELIEHGLLSGEAEQLVKDVRI